VSARAPSDCTGAARGERIVVGGRVTRVTNATLELADAFARVDVDLVDLDAAVVVGDLCVVDGTWTGARVEAARVVEVHRPRDVSALREHARASRIGPLLRARAAILARVRARFAEQGFVEVETPCAVPSPGLDLHLDAYEVPGLGWLATSPEYQMKRLLGGGVPRCFQITRCFRRGEVGGRHNPEFTMLEWYRAFAGVSDVIDDTEQLVRAAFALTSRRFVEQGGARVDVEAPFARVTVGEAFARFAGVPADEAVALPELDEDRFFRLLVERVEPGLARLGVPVFLTDYPAKLASLARRSPADPRVCERFELYVGETELCNGFGELTDPVEQRARLERDRDARRAAGMPVYPIDERFVAALEEGMPPAAGNALGLDRLVALATGAPRIADVMCFPVDEL
jgi:lysyl-tRNA synthetase class 2